MSKIKNAATGVGYAGEIMVNKITQAIGIVDSVTEAKVGWPPTIRLKLPDGTLVKGRLSNFRDATPKERKRHLADGEAA
jgi:hypothetical protein